MAVYRCPSNDPFRNYPVDPGIQAAIDAQCAEIEHRARMAGEREEITDLVLIDGVWQLPSQ